MARKISSVCELLRSRLYGGWLLSIVVFFYFPCVEPQATVPVQESGGTEEEQEVVGQTESSEYIPENNTRITTVTSTFGNKTQLVNKTTCNLDTNLCSWDANLFYPFLGDCFSTVYRFRWLLYNSDVTRVPLVKEYILLNGDGDPIVGGLASAEGVDWPNYWSQPPFAHDQLNTSWADPAMTPLLITYRQGVDARQVCVVLGREKPAGALAVDGKTSEDADWRIVIKATAIEGDACIVTDDLCVFPIIQPKMAGSMAISPPANFQLVETVLDSGIWEPVACPDYGACLAADVCADYMTGLLCHQCTYQGVGDAETNGTRLRDGEMCTACPLYWLPWIKIVVFYIACIVAIGVVLFVQYRSTRAPMFSPAAMADIAFKERDAKRYRKEMMLAEYLRVGMEPPEKLKQLNVDEQADKDAAMENTSTLSPTLMACLLRQCIDHHILCCISWEFSGIALCWPEKFRDTIFMINMDWWNILSMNCAGLTYLVDDLLWYAVTALPIHWTVCFLVFWMVYNDKCGCCVRPEQALLTDREALEEAFARIDKDENGMLTKGEILKAIEPPPELKRMPKVRSMIKAGVVVMVYMQNPMYNRLFLTNLDCTKVGGVSKMRIDLREPCEGDVYNSRVYASMFYLTVFNIGGIMISMFYIWQAKQQTIASEDEDGQVQCDAESAFSFMLAGFNTKYWWFSCWKMFIKEAIPIIIILNRAAEAPTDPGVSDSPGELALMGLAIGFVHDHIRPYEHMYVHPLGTLERLTWGAFCAPPLCKMLIGNRVEVTMHLGEAVIGQWTKQAETWFQWSLLFLCLFLYFMPFIAGAFYLAGEELGLTKVHTVNIEVAERIHVTLPPKGRERRQLCHSIAKLFEHAMLSVARMADEVEMPTLSPASTIEGALLIVMREDAAYWGDASAGAHAVLNVEHESLLGTIGLLQKDREKRDLALSRAILDAGGLAETCLKQGIDIKGLKVNLGMGQRDEEGIELLPPSMSGEDHADITGLQATVIALNFAIERVELRSLGFKDGERKKEDQIRPAVQRSLVRGIAVSVATGEDNIDCQVHPVGVDRTLITVMINCGDEAELQIREDWLRTSLGTREARSRWSKGLEADLGRVGATGSEGKMLMVRFNKGSKPTRTTQEGARRIAMAAVRDAMLGDREKQKIKKKEEEKEAIPEEKPQVYGSQNHGNLIDDEHCELDAFNGEGNALAKTLNKAHARKKQQQDYIDDLGRGAPADERKSRKGRKSASSNSPRPAGDGKPKGSARRSKPASSPAPKLGNM